jgi:hypothetical protein
MRQLPALHADYRPQEKSRCAEYQRQAGVPGTAFFKGQASCKYYQEKKALRGRRSGDTARRMAGAENYLRRGAVKNDLF